jgi:hypothetical protein
MNSGSKINAANLRSLHEAFTPFLNAMKGGAAAVTPGVGANAPVGSQLIETFIITVIFSLTMQVLESTFSSLKKYEKMSVDLFPLTYDSPQTWPQDPYSQFQILEPSKDERNGAEFSYSAYISVQPDTFTGQAGHLKHIFHKGSPDVFPLLAPGVFFKADTNTLVVVCNSTMKWNNRIEIPNIPMKKWFHLVVMLKGRALDVYINGNLANRIRFSDLPKLNYGALYVFLPAIINIKTGDLSCDEISEAKAARSLAIKAAQDKAAAQRALLTAGVNNAGTLAAVGAAGVVLGAASGSSLAGAANENKTLGAIKGGFAALGAQASFVGNFLADTAKSQIEAGLLTAQGENVLGGTKTDITETERDISDLPLACNGRMNGFISRIKYFAFALTFSQIDKLVKEGPNPKMFRPTNQPPLSMSPTISAGLNVSMNSGPIYVPNPASYDNNLPGYQTDAWWTVDNGTSGDGPNHLAGYGPQ